MSYNGIGLKTARGTGTNGYVRKNASSQAERDKDGTQGKIYERRKLREKVYDLNYKRSAAKINVDFDKLEKEINELSNRSDDDNEEDGDEEVYDSASKMTQESDPKLSRDELREIELRVEERREKLEDDAESKGEDIDEDEIENALEKYRITLKDRKLQRLKSLAKKQTSHYDPGPSSKPYPVNMMMTKERKDQLFKESLNEYKSARENASTSKDKNTTARDRSPFRNANKLDAESKSELEAEKFIQGFSL